MENENIKFGTGVVLSPPDERDYLASSYIYEDAQGKLEIPDYIMQSDIPVKKVLNQGFNPICVPSSVSKTLAYMFYIITGIYEELSHSFLWNFRTQDQDNYAFPPEGGMVTREVLDICKKYGIPLASKMPWKKQFGFEENPDETIRKVDPSLATKEILEDASKRKLGSYMKAENERLIDACLLRGYGVVCTIPWLTTVQTWNPLIDLSAVNGDPNRGAHSVRLVGKVKKDGVRYRVYLNSHGNMYPSGLVYFPEDSIVYEQWVLCSTKLTHWADSIYDYLLSKNVIVPTKDFNVKATRGYSFEMLAKTLGYKDTDQYTRESYDVYYDYCKANGVEALEKRYDALITRGEVMALISKFIGWKDDGKPTPKGEHWAEKFFVYLNNNGIKLYDRRFNDNITKGEFLVFCAKKIGYK